MPDHARATGLAQTLFDALPVGAIIHSPDTILAANRAACDVVGAPYPEELVGRPLDGLIHPADREARAPGQELLFERDQHLASVPVRMVTLQGAPFTLSVSAASFTHDGARYVVVAASSADRVPTDERPRSSLPSTSLHEAALEAFPLPVLAVSERRVVLANAATRAMLAGSAPLDPVGEEALDLLHPDARDAMEERVGLLQNMGGRAIRVPLKSRTVDGRDLHFSALASCLTHEAQGVFLFVATDAAS